MSSCSPRYAQQLHSSAVGAPPSRNGLLQYAQRGVVFVDRGSVQPSEKGALTQPYLGGVTFELVHDQERKP